MSAPTVSLTSFKASRLVPKFIREFLQDPATTGAVCASSPFLAERLSSTVSLSRARQVLEIGPGSGVVTESLLKRLPPHARLTSIEINPRFAELIRDRFPKVRVICGAVEELETYMKRHRIEAFDCVVSSLPWTSFELAQQKEILEQIRRALRPGGEMATYAYYGFHWLPAGSSFRSLLKSQFKEVRSSPVVLANLPPAFVYHARM